MPGKYYLDSIYPFQDEILAVIQDLSVDFYLTGGTALSRCYLHHRYSDDLDFFVNEHPDFKNQCQRVISLFEQSEFNYDVATTARDTFMRVLLEKEEVWLKMDFVNDVSFHYGELEKCQIYDRVDNWRNILSNKICALSRLESKDVADILFVARNYSFNWEDVLNEAREKDLWVEPLEICRLLNDFPTHYLRQIKWIADFNIENSERALQTIHDDIFYGNINSLNVK